MSESREPGALDPASVHDNGRSSEPASDSRPPGTGDGPVRVCLVVDVEHAPWNPPFTEGDLRQLARAGLIGARQMMRAEVDLWDQAPLIVSTVRYELDGEPTLMDPAPF